MYCYHLFNLNIKSQLKFIYCNETTITNFDILIKKSKLTVPKYNSNVRKSKYDINNKYLYHLDDDNEKTIYWDKNSIVKIFIENKVLNIDYDFDENNKINVDILLTEVMSIAIKYFNIFMVHGGFIKYNNKNIIILGDGGTGKSSFTVSGCVNGAEFLSDDMIPVKKGPKLYAGYPFFKLWEDSAESILIDKSALFIDKTPKQIYSCNLFNKLDENKQKVDIFIYLIKNANCKNIRKVSKKEMFLKLIKSQISGFSNNSNETIEFVEIIKSFLEIPMYEVYITEDLVNINTNTKDILEKVSRYK